MKNNHKQISVWNNLARESEMMPFTLFIELIKWQYEQYT